MARGTLDISVIGFGNGKVYCNEKESSGARSSVHVVQMYEKRLERKNDKAMHS